MSSFTQSPEMSWSIDQSINVDRISMEELKLIFNQAEKRLDSTIKEAETIASRTMSIITLMAGLLPGRQGLGSNTWLLISFGNFDLYH